jgi:ERCC4-type nuclease
MLFPLLIQFTYCSEDKLVAPRIAERFLKYENQARAYGATIRAEPKALVLGDYMWVARFRETGHEVLLDYIVERKSVIDVVASVIKSGGNHKQRYVHQKRRIMESGKIQIYYCTTFFVYDRLLHPEIYGHL